MSCEGGKEHKDRSTNGTAGLSYLHSVIQHSLWSLKKCFMFAHSNTRALTAAGRGVAVAPEAGQSYCHTGTSPSPHLSPARVNGMTECSLPCGDTELRAM